MLVTKQISLYMQQLLKQIRQEIQLNLQRFSYMK